MKYVKEMPDVLKWEELNGFLFLPTFLLIYEWKAREIKMGISQWWLVRWRLARFERKSKIAKFTREKQIFLKRLLFTER